MVRGERLKMLCYSLHFLLPSGGERYLATCILTVHAETYMLTILCSLIFPSFFSVLSRVLDLGPHFFSLPSFSLSVSPSPPLLSHLLFLSLFSRICILPRISLVSAPTAISTFNLCSPTSASSFFSNFPGFSDCPDTPDTPDTPDRADSAAERPFRFACLCYE